MGEPRDKPEPDPHDNRGVPPRPSAFGRSTLSKDVQATQCDSCGRDLRYKLASLGREIVCPDCGRRVRLGETLLEHQERRREEEVERELPKVVLPRRRRRFWVPFIALISLVGLGAASFAMTTSLALHSGDAWRLRDAIPTTVARLLGINEDENSELPVKIPSEITLESIEALGSQEDKHNALTQAHVWYQMLQDFNVAESDPRMVRLREIIDELTDALKPSPEPPPAFLREFREALGSLREALMAEDLARARKALAAVESLLNAHEEELGQYSRSYLALKQRFTQLEFLQEGRQRVADLIEMARRQVDAEQATEAAESIAEAKFYALHTPSWEEGEYELHSEAVAVLENDLRLVRGKRAVRDAHLCHERNDKEARDRQLQVALAMLPEFPSRDVETLLKDARDLEKKDIANPSVSEFGQELSFRAAYEEALRYYGRLNSLEELTHSCVFAHTCLAEATHLDQANSTKVSDLFFNALEFEIGDLLNRSNESGDVPAALASARLALEAGEPWKGKMRWRSLDQTLRSKGNDVAHFAIARARKLAESGEYDLAIRTIEPAHHLGDESIREQTRLLNDKWKRDAEQQADLNTQRGERASIQKDIENRAYLVAWAKSQKFLRAYPNSPAKASLQERCKQLRPNVDSAIRDGANEIARLIDVQDWRRFREALEIMEEAPLPPELRDSLAMWQAKRDSLADEAEILFISLSSRENAAVKNLMGVENVLKAIAICGQVLAMDSTHEKATELLEKAHEKAEKLAEHFLTQARLHKSVNEKKCREELEEVIRLDPTGPFGLQAKKMLASMEETAANDGREASGR